MRIAINPLLLLKVDIKNPYIGGWSGCGLRVLRVFHQVTIFPEIAVKKTKKTRKEDVSSPEKDEPKTFPQANGQVVNLEHLARTEPNDQHPNAKNRQPESKK